MSALASRACRPQEGGVPAEATQAAAWLAELDGWQIESGRLTKVFTFPDHYATLAFVNALAWVSHRQDHHPDLSVGYNTCRVAYETHAVDGLSENDFICAAKVDRLFTI